MQQDAYIRCLCVLRPCGSASVHGVRALRENVNFKGKDCGVYSQWQYCQPDFAFPDRLCGVFRSVDCVFPKVELRKIWVEHVLIGLVAPNGSFRKSLTQSSLSWAFRGNTAAAAPSIHVDHNPRSRDLHLGKSFLAATKSPAPTPRSGWSPHFCKMRKP